MGGGATMAVSGHGGATTMVRRRCALLCSGVGERRARHESEMEQAAEVRGLSFHASLASRADADVRPPCGTPGLPRSATDGGVDAAIRGDERD